MIQIIYTFTEDADGRLRIGNAELDAPIYKSTPKERAAVERVQRFASKIYPRFIMKFNAGKVVYR